MKQKDMLEGVQFLEELKSNMENILKEAKEKACQNVAQIGLRHIFTVFYHEKSASVGLEGKAGGRSILQVADIELNGHVLTITNSYPSDIRKIEYHAGSNFWKVYLKSVADSYMERVGVLHPLS